VHARRILARPADTENGPCGQPVHVGNRDVLAVVRAEINLPCGVEVALMNMRIINALFRSEKSGRFEDV
jgi:hypothetical protein